MAKQSYCVSCKKKVTNDAGTSKFMCPKCGKYEIVRCTHCRKIASRYICAECGFTGPN